MRGKTINKRRNGEVLARKRERESVCERECVCEIERKCEREKGKNYQSFFCLIYFRHIF